MEQNENTEKEKHFKIKEVYGSLEKFISEIGGNTNNITVPNIVKTPSFREFRQGIDNMGADQIAAIIKAEYLLQK